MATVSQHAPRHRLADNDDAAPDVSAKTIAASALRIGLEHPRTGLEKPLDLRRHTPYHHGWTPFLAVGDPSVAGFL